MVMATKPTPVSLASTVETRDGTLTKDAHLVNGLVENTANNTQVVLKRPGTVAWGIPVGVSGPPQMLARYLNSVAIVINGILYIDAIAQNMGSLEPCDFTCPINLPHDVFSTPPIALPNTGTGIGWTFTGGVLPSGSTIVVGSASTVGGLTHAFRWTQAGGMVDIGTLGGASSMSYGCSSDASVVVGYALTAGAAQHAFRWTQAGGMVDLGTLGGVSSGANCCSSDGSVVVGIAYTVAAVQHAFRWTQAGGMVDLGTLGGTSSVAYACSSDGSVVVGTSTIVGDTAFHAFRWTQAGGMVDLGTLGGTTGRAYACSSDGSVIVGMSYTVAAYAHAFRWTQAGGMVDLGTLGGTSSGAQGVKFYV